MYICTFTYHVVDVVVHLVTVAAGASVAPVAA